MFSCFGCSGFLVLDHPSSVLLAFLVLDHPFWFFWFLLFWIIRLWFFWLFLFRIICFGSSGFLVLDHLSLVLLPFYKYQIYLMFVVMFLDSYCSNLKQIGKQQHLQILIYNYPLQLLQIDHLHHIASRL